MPAGISAAAAADMLDTLGDPYIQLHWGDPGDDGTSNVVTAVDRMLADLNPSDAGARTLAEALEWPDPWTGGPQTVTHLSAWTADTGGTFLFSVALLSHVNFIDGMLPRLTGLSIVIPSVAAD